MQALPGWRGRSVEEFTFADPKGFSTFTMAVRAPVGVAPPGILYRRLEGKENAILDPEAERAVYLTLSDHGVAARCRHYEPRFRLEELYSGQTLAAKELFDRSILNRIAEQLVRLHRLEPPGLPREGFFALLHHKWGGLARFVLEDCRHRFPAREQPLCDELGAIFSQETARMVQRCLPDGPLTFCHNDTYHGNIMGLADGRIRLLDFEFSCLNHKAFDFANLFAETVMQHGLTDYPYFAIAEPSFGTQEITALVEAYLAHAGIGDEQQRDRLVQETQQLIPLSDYMYAMAALPLALEPIQKIPFLPYSAQRFRRFLNAYASRFG